MIANEILLAGIMLIALTFYVLSAGADYGGGVWDLLAVGPRAQAQRDLIASAIAPIWEANHVWLILVVVILFTAFPLAFSTISVALHIPLVLMLIGIVLRGTAFTFRTYDSREDNIQQRWTIVFSIASTITPVFLGITIGAISSGRMEPHSSDFVANFISPWLAPFPFAVGFFALTIFTYLAAVYLTNEAKDLALQEDFRAKALISSFFVALFAIVVFVLSNTGAPLIYNALLLSPWTWPLHFCTGLCAITAMVSLWFRHYKLARISTIAQVTLIMWGWAFAQFPFLIQPDIDIFNAASPAITLRLLLIALVCGALILFPSIFYLLKVFKGNGFEIQTDKSGA